MFPSGRRRWNLKFSYLADDDRTSPLFPVNSHSGYGIFEYIGGGDDDPTAFSIKEDFISKVWFGSNCGQLPFIFQPNQSEEEYAICRFDGTPSFTQVANGVYDICLDIVVTW